MKEKGKKIIQHLLTFALLALSLCYSVLYFGKPIFFRYGQAFEDLYRSFAYYFIFITTLRDDIVMPTVQLFPSEMETLLPLTYEEFRQLLERFSELFLSEEVFLLYLDRVLEIVGDVAYYVSLFALPVFLFVLIMYFVYKETDTDYNQDSKPLKKYKKFRDKRLRPVVRSVVSFFKNFIGSRRGYWLSFALIWAYNLNFLTIGFEALAFIFWVGPARGLGNIFVQIAKFVIDFSVAGFFFPWWVWAAVGYYLFHLWRRHLGTKNLKEKIKLGFEFIKKYVGAIFVVGRQRSKKTSTLVMLKFLYERYYRERAEKKLHRWKKRFPNFPWINVIKFTQKARAERKLFMIYHCRQFARRLRLLYRVPNTFPYRNKLEVKFRKKYGYDYEDFLFGYNPNEGGLSYDNKLEILDIFKAIEMYMQLFWVYGQERTLDFSNFAIREDFTFVDHGNFPIFDGDLLKKTTEESNKASRYSQIIDFDAFRPGVKFDEDNPFKDSAEYGIRVVEEFAKERGNQFTREKGSKDDKDLFATQNNDGYELDNKVRGQVALIDFDDYSVSLYDDQREGSLGADNKDLATVAATQGVAEEVMLLPFFEIEEALFLLFEKIYDKIYKFLFSRKGSNTLLMYFLDRLFCPIFAVHERLTNEFTASKVKLRMRDGAENGAEHGIEEFWILHVVAYRGRYAPDSCKSFYEFRFERSTKGMDDYETYDGIDVNMKQRGKQRSYFSETMMTKNGIKSARKPRKK